MFVDYAKIHLEAGDGGNGCLAFRREKYVPRGGPSGGDGGRGGDIVLQSNPHLSTLLPFKYKKHFKAQRGRHGSGNKRHGKDGQDLIVEVPVGTVMSDADSGEVLFDFSQPEQTFVAARGGRGGRGNAAFATATNQAPRRIEPGAEGQQRQVVLELKTLADVGLIGLPNAGKSTLISAISAARPEIADYPFTTLSPNLGVVSYHDFHSFVVADIPGLIEGAHQGSGLGDRFLRHVERTRLLVHMIDVSDLGPEDPEQAYLVIERELKLYKAELAQRDRLVVASKIDAANPDKLGRLKSFCRRRGLRFLAVSAATGKGLSKLRDEMARCLGVGSN